MLTNLVGPVAEARHSHRWCFFTGEPCSKMKRAAEPLAEAIAAPLAEALAEPHRHKWCWFIGQPCNKIKRALDDLKAEEEQAKVTRRT